jgi:Domain of unknown function (DUF427)
LWRSSCGPDAWCEWKDQASSYDLGTDTRVAPKAAWTYLRPTPGFRPIAGAIAVMAAQVDRCTVKREQVIPQPAGCYGGWITSWVAALDQPHVHKQPPVDLAVEVDRNHMRAVQPRGRMGFTTARAAALDWHAM